MLTWCYTDMVRQFHYNIKQHSSEHNIYNVIYLLIRRRLHMWMKHPLN